jgi:hypothetical protein
MKNNYITKELIQHFKARDYFSREELYNFYKQFEPELNEHTFGWRIHNLKKKNIIKPLHKGIYTISSRPLFIPGISKNIQKISHRIKSNFTGINYNLWETRWLMEFTRHQAAINMIILEAEKDIIESIFYLLKDKGFKNVFLEPDRNLMEKYITEEHESILVKPMISRSPTLKINKIPVAALEKILVDLFCDTAIFYPYGGVELVNIYSHAFEFYAINFSKLFNYAGRRRRETQIKKFIMEHYDGVLKEIAG